MSLKALLGIDLPIIQAPMAGAQGSAMAIAVSNAGGLGSLPCAMLDADGLRRELATIRQGTTRPFNVNFFCHRRLDDRQVDAQQRFQAHVSGLHSGGPALE